MDRLFAALCIFICMNGVYRYSSAALITPCANDDACKVHGGDANSECLPATGNGACVCKSTHKDDGSGTCVPKGLLDACSKADDCTAVTHATCKGSTCQCEAAYKTESKTCVAREHGDPCTVNGDCTGQLQECSGTASSKVCTCSTGYSYNGTKCVVGHGDTCTVTAVCTGLNLKCDTSKSTHVCACKDGYSQDSTHANCIKGLTDTCSSTAECAAVTHATCTSGTCQCEPAYKEDNGNCIVKEHGDPCTANTDCTGQSQECSGVTSSKVCTCIAGHSFVGKICVVVGHGDACKADADCTGLNLKCDTSKSAHVCACKDGFSQDGVNCVKGYGDVCTANEDCTGQNLECNDSDPKACACKSGYSKDGVNCIKVPDNSADVTSMAFPVAIALLSIALFGKLC